MSTLTREPAPMRNGGGLSPSFAGDRQPYAYNRLSKFRPKDQADVEVTRAVHRQAADAERAAAERDLGPVVHITDEGQSASRFASRERDGWPVLLDAIRAGRVSYVLVWLLDRVIRQTRDLDDLIDLCRETGTLILQTGTGTIVNPDDPDSVGMAKIQGVLAETEVAKMSKRVRRAHDEKARLGQFHGGKRRFGYNADMTALDVAEAAIIQRAAADIIAGRTLHSIAKELNATGTPPPLWKGFPYAMGTWTGSNLGTMMKRPHLAGLREHGGELGQAAWEPILSRETWDAVVAVLSAEGRRTTPTTARQYLLSGIIRCGICEGRLRHRSGGKRHADAYMCPAQHVHRTRELVDARVIDVVLGRISQPGFSAAFLATPDSGDRDAITARIEAIESNLDGIAADVALGLTPQRRLNAAQERANPELDRLRAALTRLTVAGRLPSVLHGLADNPDAAAVWDGLDLDRRRAVVDAVATYRLEPAARKGAPFDPASVVVTWRTVP